MIPGLPFYISVLFAVLVLGVSSVWLRGISLAASHAGWSYDQRAKAIYRFGSGLALWLFLTGALALSSFFMQVNALPPRMLIAAVPAILFAIYLARAKKTAQLLQGLSSHWIVAAQSFRFVIEVIFYLLLINNAIPELMTFEGRNFDIVIGATAPIVAWLYKSKKLNDTALRIWNYAGLAILMNVVIHGVLATPSPIQQIVTTPPNNFLLHFPFVWLPAVLVPTAFAGHLLSLRQLSIKQVNASRITFA